MRRVVAVITGNFDYWGPAGRQVPGCGAGGGQAAAVIRMSEQRRKNRLRRAARCCEDG